jgi:hypothetical protein
MVVTAIEFSLKFIAFLLFIIGQSFVMCADELQSILDFRRAHPHFLFPAIADLYPGILGEGVINL